MKVLGDCGANFQSILQFLTVCFLASTFPVYLVLLYFSIHLLSSVLLSAQTRHHHMSYVYLPCAFMCFYQMKDLLFYRLISATSIRHNQLLVCRGGDVSKEIQINRYVLI